MNIQHFIFKFFVICTYIIRMSLIILPLSIVGILSKEGGWKYGFTFIQNNFDVALFVAFAIGFLVAMYHAVSFEIVGGAPLENYLKVHQKVKVRGAKSVEALADELRNEPRFRKIVVVDDNTITAQKQVYFMQPDKVRISLEGDLFIVESRPYWRAFFIDFGRNFKTVKRLAQIIKSA